MQARNLFGSALLATGMLLAGCGGAAPVAEEQPELVSHEDALPDCTGQNYEREYYSDATYTTLIGVRGCSCGYYFSSGRTSSYVLFYDYGACW